MYEYQEPTRKSGLFLILAGGIIGALAALMILPLFFGLSPTEFYKQNTKYEPVVVNTQKITKETLEAARLDNPVVAVAKKVQPSVVLITTESRLSDSVHQNLLIPSDGSGVIYQKNGFILTNNHVVQDAQTIVVKFADGQESKGEVVGRDPESDLAVIKVDRTGLPAATFGTTADLSVGDIAVAIGSPFGYEGTVTSGVISALHRNVSAPDDSGTKQILLTDMIQTDAAINPGNSGGALCNQFGQVIGINTLIITGSGENAGIGFAIPIDLGIKVANQLIKGNKVSHPYIGVYVETLDTQTAAQFNIKETSGAIVVGLTPNSPASKAGIKEKDVIAKIDDQKITTSEELIGLIRQRNVGDKLKIELIRAGKQQTVTIELAEKP